ncbi:MAG: hypothetical protein CMM50_03855 [Rhodospirillaceae bacterium]|nr:hypothetical protein [Rhodospirillaceae bacterium]|tara:strand:+ start:99 stop:1589 length:1491 start_codon:yes stop_codon:yes gene_type:complete
MYFPRTPTAQQVRFHALHRPEAVALIDGDVRTTYAGLDRQIAILWHAFQALGLRNGETAAVSLAHLHHELPALLACEELGVATLSFGHGEDDVAPFALADHILADHPVPKRYADKQRDLSPDAFQSLLKTPLDEDAPKDLPGPDEPARIIRTSGTTGIQKAIAVSREILARRIGHCRANLSITRTTRYLITYPFSVATSYHAACASLWAGGTVIKDRSSLVGGLTSHDPTLLIFLPRALYGVLETLPADFAKPPFLVVRTLGASLPPAIRERLMERLATEVVEGYGTNETGAICEINARKVGMVIPGVEVGIVDQAGKPAGFGQLGLIRVRSRLVVDRYLDSAETTERHFKDGWFLTNDLGVMAGPRSLQLLGRADDVVNIGGIKVMAPALEERIIADARIRDTGIAYLADPTGNGILSVGIVLKEGAAVEDVTPGIEELIEPVCKSFRIVVLPAVPRTAFGKLQRHILANTIAEAFNAAKPVPAGKAKTGKRRKA